MTITRTLTQDLARWNTGIALSRAAYHADNNVNAGLCQNCPRPKRGTSRECNHCYWIRYGKRWRANKEAERECA